MEISQKRSMRQIALGLFLLSHPAPVLLHILGVGIFTLLAAAPHPIWSTVALVIAAHAAMQISIAMINDYCDRRLDATGKPRKPIPRGLITPREALLGGIVMMGLMLLLLLPLNPLALWLSLAYLVLGQGYNLGLKSTPLSGIVFALAMPLIPLYAFAGIGRTLPLLIWLVPVGFLLGVALNLANASIDIEEDSAMGARTLAVVLGLKPSLLTCRILIILCVILVVLLTATRIVPARLSILAPTLLITGISVIALFVGFGLAPSEHARKVHFYIAALTCIVLACGWLIGVIL